MNRSHRVRPVDLGIAVAVLAASAASKDWSPAPALAAASGAAPPPAPGTEPPSAASAALAELFHAYWEFRMRESPTWATYLGDHRYNDRLADMSEEAALAGVDTLRLYQSAVQRVDRSLLSKRDRTSAELFARLLARRIEGAAFRPHLLPISQQGGPHIGFPQLIESHPFESIGDYEDFIARLEAFPSQVDQIIACMRKGIEAGLVRYRPNIEKVLPQLEKLIVDDPAEHVLAGPAVRLETPDDDRDDDRDGDRGGDTGGNSAGDGADAIPPAERRRLAADVRAAIAGHVVPAYRRLAEFLEQEYLPACRTDPGIWALPDGGPRYAFLIRRYTTVDRTPEEIHELGLQEMARIRREMDAIRARVGYEGDLDAFLEHLRTDPSFYYDDPAELMDGFRAILARMDERLPLLFGRLPEAPYDLKEMEAYRAAAAPAAYYYSPPDDGSRPGYFYVNTYNLPSRPRYTMEALAYHEAVPGHHLQIAIQQELGDMPDFRRHQGFTAFTEGWGLYSEGLPREVGLYADPYSEFGRLTFEAWRASRLVVDTGIHALGWSRDEAITYLKSSTALGEHDIASEVDRYIAWPGQALAYKIGELKIRELRRRAEAALGAQFDVRRFHDVVLENGALPLDLLERFVDAWITEHAAVADGDS